MLSRALSLATAMLLIGFAAPASIVTTAQAQNLEAGKSPAQLFSANCTVCHKSARGLLKSVSPADLSGFLRQHYTTSADMAKSLSGYVAANGTGGGRNANDDGLTRRGRELSREQAPAPGDAAPNDRRLRPAAERQPGPDGAAEPAPRRGRKAKRAVPAEAAAPAGEAPAAATEAPAAPKAKSRKGNRLHPAPKTESKPETDRTEPTQAAPAKPAEETKPAEAAKPEAPATRADPVPAVTPAPKEAEPAPAKPEPAKPDAQ